jgi:hypothetical protein
MLRIPEDRVLLIVGVACALLIGAPALADDHGDAPVSYGDASHVDGSFEWLGFHPGDDESPAWYSADATGDDVNNVADEDGVQLVWDGVSGSWAVDVTITVADRFAVTPGVGFRYNNPGLTGAGQRWLYVNAWWDADDSGTFDAPERFVGVAYNPRVGITTGTFAHPAWTSNSQTYRYALPPSYGPTNERDFFRFRLTYGDPTAALPGPTGPQPWGEAEDHSTIPEPVSLALLGFGIAALAQRRRKKK